MESARPFDARLQLLTERGLDTSAWSTVSLITALREYVQRDDAIHIVSDSHIEAIHVTLQPTEIRTFVITTKPSVTTSMHGPASSIHIN